MPDSQTMLHTIILDAGPMLKNEPSVSTLLANCEKLVTVPSVLSEIKDQGARSRVETTVRPFLTLRDPSPSSIQVITDFARKTGDLAVLSRPDTQLLALAYELECERNDGDWRLRKVPGQKGLNGSPPSGHRAKAQCIESSHAQHPPSNDQSGSASPAAGGLQRLNKDNKRPTAEAEISLDTVESTTDLSGFPITNANKPDTSASAIACVKNPNHSGDLGETLESNTSDSEGWITPSNIKSYQAKNKNSSTCLHLESMRMQVAVLTTDYAMQNVLLQMNLNLLSPSMQRIRNIKTFILRCHACFEKTRDLDRQFCPRCGKPTLTRVSCSTSQDGKFVIHLKKNKQWNHRGDRFSIPKPVSGAANGKAGKGGGKGGWGQALILVEDQKEYVRAINGQSRKKDFSLKDNECFPGILTGRRGTSEIRPKIGGGQNINSVRR